MLPKEENDTKITKKKMAPARLFTPSAVINSQVCVSMLHTVIIQLKKSQTHDEGEHEKAEAN